MNFYIVDEMVIRDILWVIYAISLGTFGNILYRINNNLIIKPFWNRVLYGLMGVGFYVSGILYFTKDKPKLNIIVMLLIFVISYFVELFIEILEQRLPSLIDRIINKLLNDNYSLKTDIKSINEKLMGKQEEESNEKNSTRQ